MLDLDKLVEELKEIDNDYVMPINSVKQYTNIETMDEQQTQINKLVLYICDYKYQLVCYIDKTKNTMMDINIEQDDKYYTVSYYNTKDNRIQRMIVRDIIRYFTNRSKKDLENTERVKIMLDYICSWYNTNKEG